MSIQFSEERWKNVKETYGAWWEGTLKRPVIPIVIKGKEPDREIPKAPILTQANSYDLSISPVEFIDRIDYELSKNIYLGDAYPCINMDVFGPGVVAAFLGAEPEVGATGNIWFHPDKERELKDMHFEFDPDNIWFQRIKEMYVEGNKKWNGQVMMGMADLGGTMDILATMRGTENLLYDLYDEPDEVKRLVKEIHDLWIRYYKELNKVIAPAARGYTDWSQIFSSEQSYVIQCDFCYMISNDMFREFVLDELEWMTNEIPNTIYHLDGPGEQKHLKDLLTLDKLKAIQWVPGTKKQLEEEWPDLYQTIRNAGRGLQFIYGYESLHRAYKKLGTAEGLLLQHVYDTMDHYDQAVEVLNMYGVDA